MATRNIVPRATGEGSIGTAAKHWGAGHFDSLPNWQEYLAESTGYGIVSGCTPTISGLTVTVAAGVVHLADGTRKEIAATNITLDAADASNPRIDLVYIDSTGAVAKITGTAAASPVVPTLPSGGISVCNVTIAAGASTGVAVISRDVIKTTKSIVYVDDYAVGDGVTDDTDAVNNALNRGDIVIFSPKTYLINTNGIRPKSGSILLGRGATLQMITNDLQGYRVVQLKNVNNVALHDFNIIGDRDTHTGSSGEWGHGIDIQFSENILIKNSAIKKCWGDGIYLGGIDDNIDQPAKNIDIGFCTIDYARRNGISIVNGYNINIHGCVISHTSGTNPQGAIWIERNTSNQTIDLINIHDCVLDSNYYGFGTYAFGKNCKISFKNNTISNSPIPIVLTENSTVGDDEILNVSISNTTIISPKERVIEFNQSPVNCFISIDGLEIVNGFAKGGTPTNSPTDCVFSKSTATYANNISINNVIIRKCKGRYYSLAHMFYVNNLRITNIKRDVYNDVPSFNAYLSGCSSVTGDDEMATADYQGTFTFASDTTLCRRFYVRDGARTINLSAINDRDTFYFYTKNGAQATITLPDNQSVTLSGGESLTVTNIFGTYVATK
jgi:hypothetical protein